MTLRISKAVDFLNPRSTLAGPTPAWDVYRAGVRLIALRALGDAAMADDIAQEAIARAITRLNSADAEPVNDIPAFVHGIARHLIGDAHRARYRTVPLGSVEEPVEPRVDALSKSISDDERSRVRLALLELSASDRRVLLLSFYEGLQPDEIAKQLGENAVRIRKRKSRALERLRQIFLGPRADVTSGSPKRQQP